MYKHLQQNNLITYYFQFLKVIKITNLNCYEVC